MDKAKEEASKLEESKAKSLIDLRRIFDECKRECIFQLRSQTSMLIVDPPRKKKKEEIQRKRERETEREKGREKDSNKEWRERVDKSQGG